MGDHPSAAIRSPPHRRGSEGPDIDLVTAGFVGSIGDPAGIRRKAGIKAGMRILRLRGDKWLGLGRLSSVRIERQHPYIVTGRRRILRVVKQEAPIPRPARRSFV